MTKEWGKPALWAQEKPVRYAGPPPPILVIPEGTRERPAPEPARRSGIPTPLPAHTGTGDTAPGLL